MRSVPARRSDLTPRDSSGTAADRRASLGRIAARVPRGNRRSIVVGDTGLNTGLSFASAARVFRGEQRREA